MGTLGQRHAGNGSAKGEFYPSAARRRSCTVLETSRPPPVDHRSSTGAAATISPMISTWQVPATNGVNAQALPTRPQLVQPGIAPRATQQTP
jgi:hypothetical protein